MTLLPVVLLGNLGLGFYEPRCLFPFSFFRFPVFVASRAYTDIFFSLLACMHLHISCIIVPGWETVLRRPADLRVHEQIR